MPLFYTGKGDKGKSHIGKKTIDKSCIEVEALGSLDELNSLLGAVKSKKISKEIRKHLHNAQEKLFIIQAQIAQSMLDTKYKAPEIKKEAIRTMEQTIEAIEKKIKPARKFIIPGGDEAAGFLDYARAIARRTEREVVKINKKNIRRSSFDKTRGKPGQRKINPETLAYLNRLSSLLFALARLQNKQKNKKEMHPSYT